jgi:outer membrane protein TolC
MKLPKRFLCMAVLFACSFTIQAQETLPGSSVDSVLAYARGPFLGDWIQPAVKADSIANIKITYAQLYSNYQNSQLTQEILDLMTLLEKIAQERYSQGLTTQQDVIRAKAEESAMKNELNLQISERQQQMIKLNALMTRSPLEPLAEPKALRPLPPSEKLDPMAIEGRAKNLNPSLSAGVRFLPSSSTRDAVANQKRASLALNLSGLDANHQSEILITDQLLPQAELTFQVALVGYQNGAVDFASLLDAQRRIRLIKQNQIKNQVDQQVNLAEIERILREDL